MQFWGSEDISDLRLDYQDHLMIFQSTQLPEIYQNKNQNIQYFEKEKQGERQKIKEENEKKAYKIGKK